MSIESSTTQAVGPAQSPTSPDPSDRATLTQRKIPHMVFSTGSATSQTPPPISASRDAYDARQEAALRFSVEGGVIVTGGAGALGMALARGLLEHGASGLALFDMARTLELPQSQSALDTLRADFPHASIHIYAVDVTSEAGLTAAVDQAWDALPNIRHLLCCAGVVGVVPALEEAVGHWRQVVDVNLTGSFLCTQAITAAGSSGSIVLISSLASGRTLFPQPQAAYNASKAGVASLARSLAAEWAAAGIRVNAVAPGYMDTILNEGDGLQSARDQWMARCPMGRMGAPEELIGVVVMLCSRAGSYVTGAEIRVDGGSSAL